MLCWGISLVCLVLVMVLLEVIGVCDLIFGVVVVLVGSVGFG